MTNRSFARFPISDTKVSRSFASNYSDQVGLLRPQTSNHPKRSDSPMYTNMSSIQQSQFVICLLIRVPLLTVLKPKEGHTVVLASSSPSENHIKRGKFHFGTEILRFLAVHNSSIGDLVPCLVGWLVPWAPLTIREFHNTTE